MSKDSLRLGFKAGSAWRKPRTILAIRRNLFDAPLYFLFTAAVFTSCHGVEGENDLNEIRLGAGTPGALVAKAPVNPNSIFESAVAGWETSAAVDYSQDASWQSGSVIVAQPTPVPVNLNPQQYYSPDDNVKTYIKAWHPSGELNAGIVSFDNDSATLDVLLTTKPVVGSKLDATGKNLTFDHLSTQIRFKVKADESLDSGTTLAYIRIKNAGMPTGINLIDNSLRVSPAGSDGIEVPGIGTHADLLELGLRLAQIAQLVVALGGHQQHVGIAKHDRHDAVVGARDHLRGPFVAVFSEIQNLTYRRVRIR